MLQAFLFLLSYLTDYQAVADVAHRILAAGLANVSILCCFSACLFIRHRLSNRRQAASVAER